MRRSLLQYATMASNLIWELGCNIKSFVPTTKKIENLVVWFSEAADWIES